MTKTKSKTKTKAKEKAYVSPWEITKANRAHYTEHYHSGGEAPVDFGKLKEHAAAKPGQGRGWLSASEIKAQQKG